MTRYHTLLIDADGTLLDFERSEENSFYHTLKAHGIQADETHFHRYRQINSACWKALEEKRITRAELVTRRFGDFFGEYGFPLEPEAFNLEFLDNLAIGDYLIEGAEQTLAQLAPHCRIIVATNGFSRAQTRRIHGSRIAPYVHGLAISEEAGAEKPDPAFFRYTFQKYGVEGPQGVLMVGDSLSADIAGGQAAGLDTCWFNPGRKEQPDHLVPRYRISSLEQLIPIVMEK